MSFAGSCASKRRTLSVTLAATIFGMAGTATNAADFGHFNGPLLVEVLEDGASVRLLRPFEYVDPQKTVWSVPKDYVSNGATIPKALQSLTGGPLSGKYRDAAVVHDFHCEAQIRPWEDVHLAFYNAMRANGVGETKATLMYAAVYRFGPRWIELKSTSDALVAGAPPVDTSDMVAIAAFIEKEAPTIERLTTFLERQNSIDSAADLEQSASDHPTCTPILSVNGAINSDVKSLSLAEGSSLLCGLSNEHERLAALHNLSQIFIDSTEVVSVQAVFMLPAVAEYSRSPTEANWAAVESSLSDTATLVRVAMKSVLAIETEEPRMTELAQRLYNLYSRRSALLLELMENPMPSPREAQTWYFEYRDLVRGLQSEMVEMKDLLTKDG